MQIVSKFLYGLSCFTMLSFSSNQIIYAKGSLPAEAVLVQHDVEAVKIYEELKNKYLQKTDPILIAQGDKFILYHQGKSEEFSIVDPEYDELKSVAHVVLASFALFNPLNDFPHNKAAVMQYRALLDAAEQAIAKLPLNKEEKIRQEKILFLSKQFIDKALAKNKCSAKQLEHFFQEISPLIRKNMQEAVHAQLVVIDKQMNLIDKKLNKKEREELFVVIPVTKAPRKDNLLGQYFSKHLHAPMDSARLIFAEGLHDNKAILDLVGAWRTEADLSAMFFHNPESMKKDILGEETKRQLR